MRRTELMLWRKRGVNDIKLRAMAAAGGDLCPTKGLAESWLRRGICRPNAALRRSAEL